MVDKLIKRKEAAEMLGISLDTLDHARMEGLITYVQYVEKIGRASCRERV